MESSTEAFFRNRLNLLKSFFSAAAKNRRTFMLDLMVAAGVALAAGLIFRLLIILPYSVSDQSMAPLLIPGDRVLSNRLVKIATAGFWNPQAGDLVVFTHPVSEDFRSIKRIAAKSGDTVAVMNKKLMVNTEAVPAEKQIEDSAASLNPIFDPREQFPKLVIPSPGDTLIFAQLSPRETDFALSLMKQESNLENLKVNCHLTIDGKIIPPDDFQSVFKFTLDPSKKINLASLDWYNLYNLKNQLANRFPDKDISLRKTIRQQGKELPYYVVKHPCYFLVGDQLLESYDSRFFGYVSQKALIAKPFIIYWSKNPGSLFAVNFRRLLKFIN